MRCFSRCSWLVVGWIIPAACLAAEGGGKVSFKKTTLDRVFRSEDVAVGDFNGDKKLDIAAGSVYYAAPDWKMVLIRQQADQFDPRNYSDAFFCFAEDVNRDGRTDLITIGLPSGPAWWFENPGPAGGPWKQRVAVPVASGESPDYADLLGDGRRVLVFGYTPEQQDPDGPLRRMALARPGENPNDPWPVRTFSAPGVQGAQRYAHGLGIGDVNGDGRKDVVVTSGWWEQPAEKDQAEWTFHPANLGQDCAQMIVYDFDGDGDADVFSSSAHRFGSWWHEQMPDGWKTHEIDNDISQLHAVVVADINGDGLEDLVTGKRWWAHAQGDPGGDMPAVVVWYELQRTGGRPVFVRHQVDDDSGVGTGLKVADVNGDGLLDIVTGNKKAVCYFEQVRQ